MKVLVTGASGFIGGKIVEVLSQNLNYNILATGRSLTERFNSLPNVVYFQQDLSNKTPPLSCDICIHCAGLADDTSSKEQLFLHNVHSTENLISSLQNCRVFIFISSSSVYDFSDEKIKREIDAHLNNSISLYGKSKIEAENLVIKSGIESIYILRPRAVYGPGDRVLLPRILKLIKWNKMIIPGKLSEKTSLTHITNLCEAVYKSILESNSGVHIFNIADKKTYDLNSIFSAIVFQKTGTKSLIKIPTSIVNFIVQANRILRIRGRLNQQSLDYITQPSILSTEKAETELGYVGEYEFYNSISQLDI